MTIGSFGLPLCEECGGWARVRGVSAAHHELCSRAKALDLDAIEARAAAVAAKNADGDYITEPSLTIVRTDVPALVAEVRRLRSIAEER